MTNFLVCAAVVPETVPEGEVDLDDFYCRNRRLIWGQFLLLYLVALAGLIAPPRQVDQATVTRGIVGHFPSSRHRSWPSR